VITGVGVVSAFGVGRKTFLDALAAGRHAVREIRSFDASTMPTRVAAEVPVERLDAAWVAEHTGGMGADVARAWAASGALRDRKLGFALVAAVESWRHAGCGLSDRGAWRSLALGLERAFLEDFTVGDPDLGVERGEGVRLRARVDLAPEGIAAALGLTGPSVANVSACAAGTLAVAHAASLVAGGDAEIVVCGGADSMINPLGLGGMSRLGAPSPRHAADACRPFDRRRDGLAMGEGAAVFIVEGEARALRRGARPLARILGWGSTQDAHRATAPRPDGALAARAITRALERAGLAPEAIGYVNAHGTGTPLNDPAEARALHLALGAHAGRVPTSSIKGAVGHLMAASGAIEIASCLLAFERDLLPGTAHLEEIDAACELDVIGPTPRAARVDHVLTTSFGFGGQNAALILGRCS
jgi:3-oxoacyl-[acyl-carrier-protein] synthase II